MNVFLRQEKSDFIIAMDCAPGLRGIAMPLELVG